MQVRFENAALNKFLNDLTTKYRPQLAGATRRTAIESVALAKKILPRRSGMLKRSLLAEKKDDFTYLVWHGLNATDGKLKYADVIEAGTTGPYTVRPKRRKSLLFAISEKARTKGGEVSAPAKRRLFAELKRNNKRKGSSKKSRYQIHQEVGVVLMKPGKSVTIPKKAGKWIYRDQITPKAMMLFKKNIFKEFKKLGFTV